MPGRAGPIDLRRCNAPKAKDAFAALDVARTFVLEALAADQRRAEGQAALQREAARKDTVAENEASPAIFRLLSLVPAPRRETGAVCTALLKPKMPSTMYFFSLRWTNTPHRHSGAERGWAPTAADDARRTPDAAVRILDPPQAAARKKEEDERRAEEEELRRRELCPARRRAACDRLRCARPQPRASASCCAARPRQRRLLTGQGHRHKPRA